MGEIDLLQPNSKLKEILLNKENIPILEHIIEDKGKLFAGLKKLKKEKKLKFGRYVAYDYEKSVEEMWQILDKVSLDVNKFLCIGTVNRSGLKIIPSIIGCGNGYSPDASIIIAEKTKIVKLTASLAHEYAHHLQYSFLSHILNRNAEDYTVFKEGHARGVERHIVELYSRKESNEAFLYYVSNTNLFELLSAYKWLCSALNVKPSAKVVEHGRHLSNENRRYLPDPWAIGNALFYACEKLHGKGIYSKALAVRCQNWGGGNN